MVTRERMITNTFCDDIRYELGNKHSLMGCYQDALIVDTFPLVLAKFCVVVLVLTPRDRPFIQLSVKVMMEEHLLGEQVLLAEQLKQSQGLILERTKPESARIGISLHLVFAPLIIPQSCSLKIYAETEEGVLNGGVLIVREKTEDDAAFPLRQ